MSNTFFAGQTNYIEKLNVLALANDVANIPANAAAAQVSADNAATSATNASTSATTASTQASNASTSATLATTQASNASSSASTATTQATAASNSASDASSSASTATTQATNASNSASSASTSASTATTQASNSLSSASTATTQASNSLSSASTATTQATNASNSATTASTQASNASTSAASALTSKNSSATSAQTAVDQVAIIGTAATIATAVASAAGSASTATTQASLATTNGAAQVALATAEKSLAQTARTGAEAARDAALIQAGVYATEALGRAAVADGQAFKVQGDTPEVAAKEFRRTNSTTSVLIASYPSAISVASNSAKLTNTNLKIDVSMTEFSDTVIGITTPASGSFGTGALIATTGATTSKGLMQSVSIATATTAGSGEIHVYAPNGTGFICTAVWTVSYTGMAAGVKTFTAGGGSIPDAFEIPTGSFIAYKAISGGLYFTSGGPYITITESPGGVGSSATRTSNTNYFAAISFTVRVITNTVGGRLLAAEVQTAKVPVMLARDQASGMLLLPGFAAPSGWYTLAQTVMGMSLIVPDDTIDIASIYGNGEKGVVLLPGTSGLYQDAIYATKALVDADPVLIIRDISPNRVLVKSTNNNNRPMLKITDKKYLSFDDVDDGMTIPAAAITGGATTFTCRVALKANSAFPYILGDWLSGVGFGAGFTTVAGLIFPRFFVNSGTFASPVYLSSPIPIEIGIPVTLTFSFTGTELVIYQSGVEVARTAAVGTYGTGTDGLTKLLRLCTSGSGGVRSPMDFYGCILISRIATTKERECMERAVAGSGIMQIGTVQAAVTAAQKSILDAAVPRIGNYFGLTSTVVTTNCYALGDSTVAMYLDETALIELVGTDRIKNNLAVPGHTIEQQQSVWNATTVVAATVGWVVVQLGLNNMNPATTAAAELAKLQSLITSIRSKIGLTAPILISKMTPAAQRWTDVYGATNGPIAQQKWIDMNDAIAGNGSTPITGVQARIISHVPLMADSSGNLKAEFNTGDGIHPTTAGRTINAAAWKTGIAALGLAI
jgi:hypothetical protein